MYKYLTGDNLPTERCKGKESAIRVAEIALATQDFDIIQDLRELNGRPKDTSFDVFWSEIKSLVEAHARVDDRRHGEIYCYDCCIGIIFVNQISVPRNALINFNFCRRGELLTGRNVRSRLEGASTSKAESEAS